MKSVFRAVFVAAAIISGWNGTGFAQQANPAPQSRPTDTAARFSEAPVRDKLNAWTVGIAAGQLEGAPIHFAAEIGRVVDDGDNLHVLPIVTRGPAENVEALLYLKGVDLAIINADALAQFRQLVPNIQQRITYIISLFPSELHIFVRPEVRTLDDLRGRKVNFNTPGTAAAYSGPLIFDHLRLDVDRTFIPHQVALEQMRKGENDMAAVVFVTSKPIDAFTRARWEPGFHFLPFNMIEGLDFYTPTTLTAADYPNLIPVGESVKTIAMPTILAAYNWQRGSDRYRRVARFTEYLFARFPQLQQPGFHPKWKGVDLNQQVPGLNRFPTAQEWLDRTVPGAMTAAATPAAEAPTRSAQRTPPLEQGDRERLFRLFEEFLEWRGRAP
jgi:TRAP-type uncharacterized transport system substrate-binding protein